jgi:hypothetical protein
VYWVGGGWFVRVQSVQQRISFCIPFIWIKFGSSQVFFLREFCTVSKSLQPAQQIQLSRLVSGWCIFSFFPLESISLFGRCYQCIEYIMTCEPPSLYLWLWKKLFLSWWVFVAAFYKRSTPLFGNVPFFFLSLPLGRFTLVVIITFLPSPWGLKLNSSSSVFWSICIFDVMQTCLLFNIS